MSIDTKPVSSFHYAEVDLIVSYIDLGSDNHVALIAGTVSACLVFLLVACTFLWWKFMRRSKTKGGSYLSLFTLLI